jgi:hypothetical protein
MGNSQLLISLLPNYLLHKCLPSSNLAQGRSGLKHIAACFQFFLCILRLAYVGRDGMFTDNVVRVLFLLSKIFLAKRISNLKQIFCARAR